MESCPTVLIGMVFDVSASMREVVTERTWKKNSNQEMEIGKDLWDTVVRLIKYLTQDNKLCVTRTFAFGAGARSRRVRGGPRYSEIPCPNTFDILRSLKEFKLDRVLLKVMKKESKYKIIREDLVVDKVLSLLEENGANSVRRWASNEEISNIIDKPDQMSALFLAALEEDPEYLGKVVKECLPEYCTTKKTVNKPDEHYNRRTIKCMYKTFSYLQSQGVYSAKEVKQFCKNLKGFSKCFGCAQKLKLIDTLEEMITVRKEKDIRETARKATVLFHDMHPTPETAPIETGSALFTGAQALDLLQKHEDILHDPDMEQQYTIEDRNKLFDSYIFGEDCLIEALEEAVKVFKNNTADKKILFVFSAGNVQYNQLGLSNLKRDLEDLEVDVVSCYIDAKPTSLPKILYCKPDREWTTGCKFMYELSSTISTRRIPRTIFLERNWNVEIEDGKMKETKLFTMVNNADLLDDVSSLIKKVAYEQNALCDILESISLDVFINTVTVNDKFTPPLQEKKTCYANAIAAVVYMTMKRIEKREADPLPTRKNEMDAAKNEQEEMNAEEEIKGEEEMDAGGTFSEPEDPFLAAAWRKIDAGRKLIEYARLVIRGEIPTPPSCGIQREMSGGGTRVPTPSSREIQGQNPGGRTRVPTPSEKRQLPASQTEIGYPYYDESGEEEVSKNFQALREEIIEEFGGPGKGANTAEVLEKVCRKFRLQTKKVGLVDALKSVSNQQPVVATFQWTKAGKKQFEDFYRKNPKGILSEKNEDGRFDLGERSKEDVGHAVVLTSYSSNGLKFMNSWGTKWGDSGFFTLASNDPIVDILDFKFYTVFYEREDLTIRERRTIWANFNREPGSPRKKTALQVILDKYSALKLASHDCDVCNETSRVLDYKGSFEKATCPTCDQEFNPGKYPELVLALYLRPIDRMIDMTGRSAAHDDVETGINEENSENID